MYITLSLEQLRKNKGKINNNLPFKYNNICNTNFSNNLNNLFTNIPNKYIVAKKSNITSPKILSYNSWVNIYYLHLENMYNILIENINSKNITTKNIKPDFNHFCQIIYNKSNKIYTDNSV